MTAPHRTHAGPVLPVRPALTWWQRAMVRAMPEGWLRERRWYRAHVGGAWTFYGGADDPALPFDPQAWQPRSWDACAVCNLTERLKQHPRWLLRPGEARYLDDHVDHACEVYPYGSLLVPRAVAADVAQTAETFDEFCRRYEHVRIVDLGRVTPRDS